MIPVCEPILDGNEKSYLLECIETGWISSQGRFISDFENAFAVRHGVSHGVATSSCTTALHLALLAAGVGPGDEVLCPDLTFIAPANMIALTGARPVLVDVEPGSWAIDPVQMKHRITPRTRAVIVVHPFGHAANMEPILKAARDGGFPVIEDNAEAPGALYGDRLLGTMGEFGCYSFFANKILTTGEGGMVLCNDERLDRELRTMRDHGMSRDRKYLFETVGFNYRMTNMQAAIGLAQLERFDAILTCRADQAAHYARRFEGTSGATWRPALEWCTPVHWLATITLDDSTLRDPLLAHMAENGIDARQMIPPVHEAVHFRASYDDADFPVATSISRRSLHLPSATALTDAEIDRICDTVLEWLQRSG